MSTTTETSRRAFLKSGAIVAAPIAAVGIPAAALAGDGAKAKLARLEDERTIAELHSALIRRINKAGATHAGEFFANGKAPKLADGLRGIAPDHGAEPGAIAFSEDGHRASQRHAVNLEIATELEGNSTLEQMARLQGNTLALAVLPRTMIAEYVRAGSGWAIEKLAFA
jgi:hypothetical protein